MRNEKEEERLGRKKTEVLPLPSLILSDAQTLRSDMLTVISGSEKRWSAQKVAR